MERTPGPSFRRKPESIFAAPLDSGLRRSDEWHLAQALTVAFERSQDAVLRDVRRDPVGNGFEVGVGVAHGNAQSAFLEKLNVVGPVADADDLRGRGAEQARVAVDCGRLGAALVGDVHTPRFTGLIWKAGHVHRPFWRKELFKARQVSRGHRQHGDACNAPLANVRHGLNHCRVVHRGEGIRALCYGVKQRVGILRFQIDAVEGLQSLCPEDAGAAVGNLRSLETEARGHGGNVMKVPAGYEAYMALLRHGR